MDSGRIFSEKDPDLRLDEIMPGKFMFQYRDGFAYGSDAVLLSRFVRPPHRNSVGVEFGTGTGIIPILLCAEKSFKHITAFEIQQDYADLAAENMRLCGCEDRVRVIWDSLENAAAHIDSEVDFVFTNPPYMKMTSGYLNEGERKLIARHEKSCTVESICRSAALLLKNGGNFFVVYRPERMVDLFCAMRASGIEPKELITVHSRAGDAPKLILCRGKKSAAPSLVVAKPMIL